VGERADAAGRPEPRLNMTDLLLFNTLGRRLAPLRPLVPGQVRIYGCGPTVYNDIHIGNLRSFLVQDLLRRVLRHLGFAVTQVMNLTDVDDKTIQGAQAAGKSLADYTAPFIRSFMADLEAFHIERVERYPRATEHIAEILELIGRLVERGVAYESEGSVFFSIARFPGYGRLSGFDLDQMRRGERVASDEYGKEDVRDFVLWKAAKPGEPAWESPWGPGRPGWHVECSAMSMKYLGETFDVHCGGVDLIFPHHENEIAQSEAATGKPFVQTWLHSEHLIVDGQKMSKSLGNQFTLKDLLARGASARALRYLFLSVHYRQKLNFTFQALDGAAGALRRIDEMRFRLRHASERAELPALADPSPPPVGAAIAALRRDFAAGLADDLNVSASLAALFGFVKEVNVAIEGERLVAGDKARIEAALAEADEVLGVLDAGAWTAVPAASAAAEAAEVPEASAGAATTGKGEGEGEGQTGAAGEAGGTVEAAKAAEAAEVTEIERLVRERDEARRRRDFAAADQLRKELAGRGIVVEDTPHGARWKRR
jgi:cysteinyl-tRNA synthetase